MKSVRYLIVITALVSCACTNNNHNTGGIDSASVSTDASMQNQTSSDTGMTSSDSTDIRMPMADSIGNAGFATGQGDDSSQH